MWKLLLLLAVVECDGRGPHCKEGVFTEGPETVACMRFEGTSSRNGLCKPKIQQGLALRSALKECTRHKNNIFECPCVGEYHECIGMGKRFLHKQKDFNNDSSCNHQLMALLNEEHRIHNSTDSVTVTETAPSDSSTETTTVADELISEQKSMFRVARKQTRKKAAFQLMVLSICMCVILICQLIFIRLLRDAHRRQYEYYVSMTLSDSKREGGESKTLKRSGRNDTKTGASQYSAEKGVSQEKGEATKTVKKPGQESRLATFQWNTPPKSQLPDEPVTDFYNAWNHNIQKVDKKNPKN